MDAEIRARRALELDLREALRNGEFDVFYQPIIRLETRRISGFEALLRWRHPTRGIVMPMEFIDLAEEIGVIVPLGEWVLREACTEAQRWPKDVGVAVNLSPVQFRTRNLVTVVTSALAASGLDPKRLTLEITEMVLLEDSPVNLATLHRFRKLGVRISMEPELPAALPVQSDQDRPLVHQRFPAAGRLARDRARRRGPRQRPRHGDHRRRGGDRGAGRSPGGARLRPGARLFLLTAGHRRRGHRLAGSRRREGPSGHAGRVSGCPQK
jgi:hypothetical protein